MDAETITLILYIVGFGIAVVMMLATFQLFAIRRNLDELVRLGRERAGELQPRASITDNPLSINGRVGLHQL
jgi:hypothetical protein